jgi:hypothetical protein
MALNAPFLPVSKRQKPIGLLKVLSHLTMLTIIAQPEE